MIDNFLIHIIGILCGLVLVTRVLMGYEFNIIDIVLFIIGIVLLFF